MCGALAERSGSYYKGAATMAIKLRVISDHYRTLGEQRTRVFGVNGGTIGRAPDNDWVLPDPKRIVSGHHCEIDYRSGSYWLRDTSTNGVFLNESDEPVSAGGPVELQDGDRLRFGDYELIVSVDARIDFLPAASDEHSAARHMDEDMGDEIDVNELFTQPIDPNSSGSMRISRTLGTSARRAPATERASGAIPERPPPRTAPPAPAPSPAAASRGGGAAERSTADSGPEWAMHTRSVTRQELADAMARRQSRLAGRQQVQPFHQQASTWADLQTALLAFCRGAGIDAASLSPEAQAMLPLVAGQLLREAVVGLNDLARARLKTAPAAASVPVGGNPLRTSSGVEEALVRLFESHGRIQGGPVDSLRDVLQEAKEHEAAVQAAMRAGLEAVLGQLSPANVADQFEQGRARTLAPGQEPRARYWDHYAELHRLLEQHAVDGLPRPFTDAFADAYAKAREESRAGRHERDPDAG
jgi:type VI secretion system protein